MERHSHAYLSVPAAPSPSPSTPTQGSTTQTGRPPMWTISAQRKMTRLYVYTTLPLNKILQVVYANNPESAPGPESANKKLNALLDKQPRWLHPRTECDMGRRLTQLSNSTSRLNAATQLEFTSKSLMDHSPSLQLSPRSVSSAPTTSPVSFDLVSYASNPTSPLPFARSLYEDNTAGWPTSTTPPNEDNIGHDEAFYPFLRSTTFMTSDSSGSFHRILSGYSDAYVLAVKRLVRRFTAPGTDLHNASPDAGRRSSEVSWYDDEDISSPFHSHPFPLPGDFLSLDLSVCQQDGMPASSGHSLRRCTCAARIDVTKSPWVTADGVTTYGQRLILGDITTTEIGIRDTFDNTLLHFLAARGPMNSLFRVTQDVLCASMVNARNTAGQTFLHILGSVWIHNIGHLCQLLDVVLGMGFNMYATDHYGRNILHMLYSQGASAQDLGRIMQRCDVRLSNRRDAFGVKPMEQFSPEMSDNIDSVDVNELPLSTSPDPTADPAMTKEAQLLRFIRLAHDNPHLEDADGHNGLHCLAMATLSTKGVIEKHNSNSPTPTPSPGPAPAHRTEQASDKLDSSKDRLTLRLGLLTGLLDAGVDPNHYDASGTPPLMAFAAQLPEDDDYKLGPRILDLLIRRGANVHARNRAGETSLHVAVRCGRKLAMKTLVKKGANVHARDSGGRGVLDMADVKVLGCRDGDPRAYAHYEACRAWLSGKGMAVQEPSVMEEWGAA